MRTQITPESMFYFPPELDNPMYFTRLRGGWTTIEMEPSTFEGA